MTQPEPSLDGPRLKLARANKHIADLKSEIATFTDIKPYRIRLEPDPAPPHYSPYLRFTRPVPDHWPLIVGDCAHNLRSSLDHLAWQLVLANNGTPDERTQFPIREDALKENGRLRLPNITGGVHSKALTCVQGLQPYNRVEDPTMHPLAILQELSNTDKHRFLHLTGCTPTSPSSASWPWRWKARAIPLAA